MLNRYINSSVESALKHSRITLLTGPLRSGKTTLIKQIIKPNMDYLTLEDPETLALAKRDPVRFIEGFDRVAIDEIQRAPEIYSTIKMSVDFDQRYGRFLLAGSTDIRLMTGLANFMVGRMFSNELLPLAVTEHFGQAPTFVKKLLKNKFMDQEKLPDALLGNDLIKLIWTSGYPELTKQGVNDSNNWAECYIEELLNRVLIGLGFVRKLESFTKIIWLLIERVGKPLDYEKLAIEANVSIKTLHRYLIIMKSLYLIDFILPFYHRGADQKPNSGKVFFVDTHILASLANITFRELQTNPKKQLFLLKNFVSSEIAKQGSMLNKLWDFQYHFSDAQNHIVDIICGCRVSEVAGINISTKTSIESEDFNSLRHLASIHGPKFISGVVLYDGDTVHQHDESLFAVPISALWS